MSVQEFIITSVARTAEPGDNSTFIYKDGKEYKKLIEWDHFDEVLLGKKFYSNFITIVNKAVSLPL